MNPSNRKGEILFIAALAVLLVLGSLTVQGFHQTSPWDRGAPAMTGMDTLPCPLTYDRKPGFTSASCHGACKTYEECSQDKSFPACYHCVSKCGPGSFFNDASCGGYSCDYTKSGNAHCYKTKDLAEGPCFSCVGCDKGEFIEDPSCKGLCKNGQKCKATPSLWDNPETGKRALCYSCMFDECPEGSWPAHLCSSKCGKDETCDYIGLAGSSKGEYTSHNCVRCRKVSCPPGFFAHPLTCAPWNCPEGDCERSSVRRGLFSMESDTCFKCVPRCAKGQFIEFSFCETKCHESGKDCLPTTYPSAVEAPGKACFECRCRSYKGLFDSMTECQHNCDGKCGPEKTQYVERNSCIECNKCPVGSTLDAKCKAACKGTCTPLMERPECSKCVLTPKQMSGKCPEEKIDSPNCYFSCAKPEICLEDPRIKGCYYCGKNLFEGVGGDMYGGGVLHLPEGGSRSSGTLTVPIGGARKAPQLATPQISHPQSGSTGKEVDRCIDIDHDGNPDQCKDGNGDGHIDDDVFRHFGWRVLERSNNPDGQVLTAKTKDGVLIAVYVKEANRKFYVKVAPVGSSGSTGKSPDYYPGTTSSTAGTSPSHVVAGPY